MGRIIRASKARHRFIASRISALSLELAPFTAPPSRLCRRWPRMPGRAAHFLRERILAAITLCESSLQKCNPTGSAPSPVPPSDPAALARRVLIDYWDTKAVNDWLEENKADFQEPPEDDYY